MFQFLTVRLKVIDSSVQVMSEKEFQFLTVRLKAEKDLKTTTLTECFNSSRFD